MRRAVGLLFVSIAMACGPEPEDLARARAAEDKARDAGLDGGVDDGPAPPNVETGSVRRIEARAEVPMKGDRVDAKPGDWLLESGAGVAVVSVKKASVVDFGPRGGVDALVSLEPTVFASLAMEKLDKPTFRVVSDGHVLQMTRVLQDRKGRFDAFFFFRGELLVLETVVTSTGDEPLLSETLGEAVGWGNVPTWVEGLGFVSAGGAFPADFVARESLGVSYALGSDEGHTVARVSSLESNGFHDEPYAADRPFAVAPHQSSPRRSVSLAWSDASLGDAAMSLPVVAKKSTRTIALPELPKGTAVEIARCEREKPSGPLVTRFSWHAERRAIKIPEGCHGLRFTHTGYASGPFVLIDEFDPTKIEKLLPVAGTLRFHVTEKGKDGRMPARVLVRGIQGTPSPWWGDDPDAGAALDTIYSPGEGERPIPPGHYSVAIQRGFEYTAFEKDIEVKADETIAIEAELERVVDTRGWISADCHVHAAPSPDAPSPLPDRVLSLAASGVEVAVATDHNRITDYGPVIRALELQRFMTGIVGDEITTHEPSLGHFNAFPLRYGMEPIVSDKTTPQAIFSAARNAGEPGLDVVVQVNHPRMGSIGYFDLLRLDDTDIPRWKERSNIASLDFDALEIFNGDYYASLGKVEEGMKDWYALLKAGYRDTATGNSDSHKLTYAEAGVPRNLVRVGNDDPQTMDPHAFVEAMKKGRVVVVSGPFIRLWADGHEIGDEVPEGDIELEIRVDAAPWVDVDRVELVVNGDVVETFRGPFDTGAKRFDKKFKRRLERGDFVLAIARGSKPMTFLHRSGARPFSFTNPIFVR